MIFDEVDSTNVQAKQAAKQGAPEGTLFVAEQQTAGHGRLSRSFYSPKGKGIYMSLILRPDFSINESVLITAAAAVALRNALKYNYNLEAKIKWVNDLLLNDKKIAGILTEAEVSMEANSVNYVILGLGVNVHQEKDEFPDELKPIATSLQIEQPLPHDRNLIIAEFINEFFLLYRNIKQPGLMIQYRKYSACLGKKVLVQPFGQTSYFAMAADITDRAELIVAKENGEKVTLNSGEVSIQC